MIRTIGKLILVILGMILLPALVIFVGPIFGLASSMIGMIMAVFLPIIIIGVIIGWCARKKRG